MAMKILRYPTREQLIGAQVRVLSLLLQRVADLHIIATKAYVNALHGGVFSHPDFVSDSELMLAQTSELLRNATQFGEKHAAEVMQAVLREHAKELAAIQAAVDEGSDRKMHS